MEDSYPQKKTGLTLYKCDNFPSKLLDIPCFSGKDGQIQIELFYQLIAIIYDWLVEENHH